MFRYIPFTNFVILPIIFGFLLNMGDPSKTIQDFSLKNVDNKTISTKAFPDAKGFIVVFICNECPFAKLYSKRLNELSTKYKALDVPLLAINSMDTLVYEDESFKDMQLKAKNDKFKFPYLHDVDQLVAKNFNAEHTPSAFIIWKVQNRWVIKYKGAIDDNGQNSFIATPYVANNVDALLKNLPVILNETLSFGCRIFYR
jgi:peroxiredoxin